MEHIHSTTKHIADVLSAATAVGTLTAWLPPMAALVTIIWTCLRIWEMWTGKSISERRSTKRMVTKKIDK